MFHYETFIFESLQMSNFLLYMNFQFIEEKKNKRKYIDNSKELCKTSE